jgi:hypothetical protein
MIYGTPRAMQPVTESHALARLLGAKGSHGLSRSVAVKVQKLGTRLEQLLVPRLHYEAKKIESINNGTVHMMGGQAFRSPRLSKAMKDCKTIICFMATIGSGIEREIARLMEDNRLSDAYILDSIGSVAVENMVEEFHQGFTGGYESEDKGVTLRFSPGYCDWPITEQKNLFELFDSNATGIELLPSCLMRPRKSISGVFGVYNNGAKTLYNPCLDCPMKHCKARRV